MIVATSLDVPVSVHCRGRDLPLLPLCPCILKEPPYFHVQNSFHRSAHACYRKPNTYILRTLSTAMPVRSIGTSRSSILRTPSTAAKQTDHENEHSSPYTLQTRNALNWMYPTPHLDLTFTIKVSSFGTPNAPRSCFFQYPSLLQFTESCGASLYVIKPPHVARPFLSIIDWTVHASFSTDALIFSLSLFRCRLFLWSDLHWGEYQIWYHFHQCLLAMVKQEAHKHLFVTGNECLCESCVRVRILLRVVLWT